ncbi:MAG: hypothetical protein IJ659_04485 [Alloprevotella sp.]|nr:hypothetical protein [Alloprevotella sp.]
MKKILFLALALTSMTLTSCDKNAKVSENNGGEATEAEVKGTAVEGDNYTFTLPEGLTGENNPLGFNARCAEDNADLSVAFNEGGPTESQLKDAMANWSMMKKNGGETVEEAKVDGGIATLRSVKDGKVSEFFLVVLDGTKGISGTLSFPEDKAEKYEAVLMPMLKSFKLK